MVLLGPQELWLAFLKFVVGRGQPHLRSASHPAALTRLRRPQQTHADLRYLSPWREWHDDRCGRRLGYQTNCAPSANAYFAARRCLGPTTRSRKSQVLPCPPRGQRVERRAFAPPASLIGRAPP